MSFLVTSMAPALTEGISIKQSGRKYSAILQPGMRGIQPPASSKAMVSCSEAKVFVADTGVYGLGAYASEIIPEDGSILGYYEGERIDRATVGKRYYEVQDNEDIETKNWRKGRNARGVGTSGDYLFNPAPDCYIDGEDWDKANWARFMNHGPIESESNNVKVMFSREEATIWFVARRLIQVGEELLYSYGDDYFLPSFKDSKARPEQTDAEVEEVKFLTSAAATGFSDAQYLLGRAFHLGELGLLVDGPLAVRYYGDAGKQGDPAALRALGTLHERGLLGLPQSTEQAQSYFQAARAAKKKSLDDGDGTNQIG
eukprot:CAMPEP_0171708442 /NCGR_PEP_ID=MMETSP0991-20121206/14938_1 /TAXON_ID=483369 /ORGANISM="non described non described, Strain CCMP2098" /LENGTH=313 /DNA_ID=CAMNT_0012298465 /DNA_START=110 /DNA_END=1051 /DNA_ORIENTATION=-